MIHKKFTLFYFYFFKEGKGYTIHLEMSRYLSLVYVVGGTVKGAGICLLVKKQKHFFPIHNCSAKSSSSGKRIKKLERVGESRDCKVNEDGNE